MQNKHLIECFITTINQVYSTTSLCKYPPWRRMHRLHRIWTELITASRVEIGMFFFWQFPSSLPSGVQRCSETADGSEITLRFLSWPHRRKSVAVKSGDDAIGKSGEHHGSIQVLTAPFKWKWSSTLIKTYWGNVGLDCDFSRNQRENHSCLALSLFLNFFSTNWSLFQGSGEECVRLWCVELQSLQKSCQSIFVRYLNERPDEPWQWSVPFWQHSLFQRSFPPWSTLRASSLFYRGSATTSFTAEFTLCLRYGSRFKAHITTIVALAIASRAIRLCFKMIQNNDQEVCASKEQGTVCLGYCKKKNSPALTIKPGSDTELTIKISSCPRNKHS